MPPGQEGPKSRLVFWILSRMLQESGDTELAVLLQLLRERHQLPLLAVPRKERRSWGSPQGKEGRRTILQPHVQSMPVIHQVGKTPTRVWGEPRGKVGCKRDRGRRRKQSSPVLRRKQ